MAKRTLRRPKSYDPKRKFRTRPGVLARGAFRYRDRPRPWSTPSDVLELETTVPGGRQPPSSEATKKTSSTSVASWSLEQVLRQKEVELALLKGFWGASLTVDQKMQFVEPVPAPARAQRLSFERWGCQREHGTPVRIDAPLSRVTSP